MEEIFIRIVEIVLGAAGLFGFVEFLINRHDSRKGKMNDLIKIVSNLEKDSTRTQLLLLMADYPEHTEEIMTVAEHYFVEDDGNWYMTSMFDKWLSDNKIERPTWIK